jgi:hypothetical protein
MLIFKSQNQQAYIYQDPRLRIYMFPLSFVYFPQHTERVHKSKLSNLGHVNACHSQQVPSEFVRFKKQGVWTLLNFRKLHGFRLIAR